MKDHALRWKVYYRDKEIASWEVDDVADLPAYGAQVVVQEDERVGWATIRMRDYYVWTGEEHGWLGVDIVGLITYLGEPGWKKVLFGQTLSAHEYEDVWLRAKDDKKFAQKNGFLQGERKP